MESVFRKRTAPVCFEVSGLFRTDSKNCSEFAAFYASVIVPTGFHPMVINPRLVQFGTHRSKPQSRASTHEVGLSQKGADADWV